MYYLDKLPSHVGDIACGVMVPHAIQAMVTSDFLHNVIIWNEMGEQVLCNIMRFVCLKECHTIHLLATCVFLISVFKIWSIKTFKVISVPTEIKHTPAKLLLMKQHLIILNPFAWHIQAENEGKIYSIIYCEIYFFEVSCPDPTPAHGTLPVVVPSRHNGTFLEGTLIIIGCDPGYVPNAFYVSRCNATGKWEPPAPKCIGNNFSLFTKIYHLVYFKLDNLLNSA